MWTNSVHFDMLLVLVLDVFVPAKFSGGKSSMALKKLLVHMCRILIKAMSFDEGKKL